MKVRVCETEGEIDDITETKRAELTAKLLLTAGIDGENRKSFEKLLENIWKKQKNLNHHLRIMIKT